MDSAETPTPSVGDDHLSKQPSEAKPAHGPSASTEKKDPDVSGEHPAAPDADMGEDDVSKQPKVSIPGPSNPSAPLGETGSDDAMELPSPPGLRRKLSNGPGSVAEQEHEARGRRLQSPTADSPHGEVPRGESLPPTSANEEQIGTPGKQKRSDSSEAGRRAENKRQRLDEPQALAKPETPDLAHGGGFETESPLSRLHEEREELLVRPSNRINYPPEEPQKVVREIYGRGCQWAAQDFEEELRKREQGFTEGASEDLDDSEAQTTRFMRRLLYHIPWLNSGIEMKEVGCGHGVSLVTALNVLSCPAPVARGWDRNALYVKEANEWVDWWTPGLCKFYHQKTLLDYPRADEDLLLCLDTLQEFPRRSRLHHMRSLLEGLQENAVLAIMVPNSCSLPYSLVRMTVEEEGIWNKCLETRDIHWVPGGQPFVPMEPIQEWEEVLAPLSKSFLVEEALDPYPMKDHQEVVYRMRYDLLPIRMQLLRGGMALPAFLESYRKKLEMCVPFKFGAKTTVGITMRYAFAVRNKTGTYPTAHTGGSALQSKATTKMRVLLRERWMKETRDRLRGLPPRADTGYWAEELEMPGAYKFGESGKGQSGKGESGKGDSDECAVLDDDGPSEEGSRALRPRAGTPAPETFISGAKPPQDQSEDDPEALWKKVNEGGPEKYAAMRALLQHLADDEECEWDEQGAASVQQPTGIENLEPLPPAEGEDLSHVEGFRKMQESDATFRRIARMGTSAEMESEDFEMSTSAEMESDDFEMSTSAEMESDDSEMEAKGTEPRGRRGLPAQSSARRRGGIWGGSAPAGFSADDGTFDDDEEFQRKLDSGELTFD